MGAIFRWLKRLYTTIIGSENIRQTVQPVGAPVAAVSDGAAAAWAWSAYVEIVAAAVITNPCWLCGITIHTGVVETFNGDIAIASGDAGSEVDLAIFHVVAGIPTAVGVSVLGPMLLPFRIRIAGAPRLAVRIRKDTAASAAGVSLKVILAEGI